MNRTVLTIGGLDPSGCAGIAADLKTFMAWDVYGLAVLTVITAQNTQEVTGIYPVELDAIRAQMQAVVADITVHAVKIGLLADATIVAQVASLCREFTLTNIVVDPVLRSTTGFIFGDEALLLAYKEKLFPIAHTVTPNIDEASALTGMAVTDVPSMKEAAAMLHGFGPRHVVITGGHLETRAVDVLYDGKDYRVFDAPKVLHVKSRGLGCTFSSVLASHLAGDQDLVVAIEAAKQYIAHALRNPLPIGKGRGPLDHTRW